MPKSKDDENQKATGSVSKNDSPDTNKKQDIKAEDNVLTKDEMESLESKETKIKTSLVDRIFKKNKNQAENTSEDDKDKDSCNEETFSDKTELRLLKKGLKETTSHLDSISITVEKLDGKLESERAVATGIEERISRLTEEIGELRSMILDRERGYNEIETGFKKIEAMTEEIQPEIIKKDLDKKEREIIQITVQTEKQDALLCETNRQVKLFREQMDKIKSLNNLLKVSKNIEENISKIKDTERYTGRMAAKTEELFTELDKRITRFATQIEKIDSIDELTKELTETLDKNEVKLKEAVFKEDIEKLKSTLTSSTNENIKKQISSETQKMNQKIEDALKSANDADKKIGPLVSDQKSKDSEYSQMTSDISSLKSSFNDLKGKFELSNINTLADNNTAATTEGKTSKSPWHNPKELPAIEDIISEKKLSKLRKEIEEQTKKTEELSISISELKNSNSIQNNLTSEIKRSYDTLPSTIDSKTNEKTKELKNNITQITNLISIMQKNEHTTKNDIENIKKQINEKIKEIQNMEQTIQQKTKKEIELLKKNEDDTNERLRKELTQKINEQNTNTKQISDTITNLQDSMKYMEDSINAMKQPPSKQAINTEINSEINEKTKELKNNIEQMANILATMQKKEQNSKQDIDDLKKEINKKINEITETTLKDNTIQQKTKKEIELIKRTEEDTKEKLRKEFNQKINELNTNIKHTSSTTANLQDNMKYMEDSINAMKQPPPKQVINTAIDSEINEKTKELKNNIAQMANTLSITQKKEHSSKQDIDNLKKEINKKINEITETTLKDDTIQQKTKKEIELMKKNEEETKERLRKEFNQKINELNTNIKHTSSTTANLQDNMKYMEDSINAMKQLPSKQAISANTNTTCKRFNKNTIPDTKKTATDDSNKTKHNSIKKEISQMSYEEQLNEDINQLLYQNVTPIYDHDLRLNKVIRLIDKTEELLDKNNLKDAKKTYDDLVSAFNTICKKVPQSQIDEIYPLIEQLHNKLKNAPS